MSINPNLPHYWEPMLDHLIFLKVEVSKKSEEFKNVEQLIRNTLSNEIICLERIQNPSVYLAYHDVKTSMQARADLVVEEKQAFHGTSEDNIDIICRENFNPNAPVKHGSAYGRGTYFARDASYSWGYCVSSDGSLGRKMFVCKVLVGRGLNGDQKEFPTTMDNPDNPSVFVKPSPNSFYPEYLVELRP